MDEKTLSPAGWRGSSVGDVESVRWLPRTWTWLDEEALCAAAGTCVFSEGCGVSYVVSSHVDVAGQGSLPPCSGAVTLCVGSVVTKHLCIHLWKAERRGPCVMIACYTTRAHAVSPRMPQERGRAAAWPSPSCWSCSARILLPRDSQAFVSAQLPNSSDHAPCAGQPCCPSLALPAWRVTVPPTHTGSAHRRPC
ncbi:hypothetical protein P7K49_040479 [Saguinus oedipus]|uniref:Uncharacterized protein n=1 Tax=Saguinus oedipus TaxID=9490 RepID=A0ABQ9TDI8_SAGOE|nr:hypothetical protein P7K49_040479 [Saguinus oedipus]